MLDAGTIQNWYRKKHAQQSTPTPAGTRPAHNGQRFILFSRVIRFAAIVHRPFRITQQANSNKTIRCQFVLSFSCLRCVGIPPVNQRKKSPCVTQPTAAKLLAKNADTIRAHGLHFIRIQPPPPPAGTTRSNSIIRRTHAHTLNNRATTSGCTITRQRVSPFRIESVNNNNKKHVVYAGHNRTRLHECARAHTHKPVESSSPSRAPIRAVSRPAAVLWLSRNVPISVGVHFRVWWFLKRAFG